MHLSKTQSVQLNVPVLPTQPPPTSLSTDLPSWKVRLVPITLPPPLILSKADPRLPAFVSETVLLRTSTCFMIAVRFALTMSSVPQIVHWSVGEQISETVSPVLFGGFCS